MASSKLSRLALGLCGAGVVAAIIFDRTDSLNSTTTRIIIGLFVAALFLLVTALL